MLCVSVPLMVSESFASCRKASTSRVLISACGQVIYVKSHVSSHSCLGQVH